MNAYTSSSSLSAMSVALEPAGSSTTSACLWVAASSGVIGRLGEEVAAQEVAGVGALHVGSGVDDDVPGALGRRVAQVQGRFGVGVALPVRHDRVQSERDPTSRLTRP